MRDLDELTEDQGEVAMAFELDTQSNEICLVGYARAKNKTFTREGLRNTFLEEAVREHHVEDTDREKLDHYFLNQYMPTSKPQEGLPIREQYGKYKPVALKTKPVYAELPEKYRIKREITGDPLKGMPTLNPNPPDFEPTGRYTQERKDVIDKKHPGDFLWPEERKLMHHLMMLQNEAFAWDDTERGSFKEEFYPPVVIPVIEHKPWVQKNIPIPPGIYDEVCKIIRKKQAAGVYEPSNSSYRSRWFTVVKKDGKSLRIVHSLEPLNAVTIAHSGVPPATEELAEHFAGRACGGTLDLYVGYDERILAEESRDLTTFQTPFGAMRLVTLPMGWTNSVPIFHDDVTYMLQPEIPEITKPYIDDVPVRGPEFTYQDEHGVYETIPENPGIRRFVWEHLNNTNRILQRTKYVGATYSGPKTVIAAAEIEVVGHTCGKEGRRPSDDKIGAIMRWEEITDLRGVRAYARIFPISHGEHTNYKD